MVEKLSQKSIEWKRSKVRNGARLGKIERHSRNETKGNEHLNRAQFW